LSLNEIKNLREKARSFLSQAEEALKNNAYDVSVFLADISAQLYLKSILLELIGDYLRTHSLRMLLGEISRHVKSSEVGEFMRVNRARITALEDAYFTTRYSIRPFEKEDAEDAVRLVKEIMELFKT